jgi:Bacterial toxin 23
MQAQTVNAGAKVGVVINLGTHVQKLGVQLGGFIAYHNGQLNSNIQINKSFRNIGPRTKFLELQWRNALLIGFEKSIINFDTLSFFNNLSYLQLYKIHIGYGFNIYKDTRGTSQNTGSIKLGYQQFGISTENDAFAFSAWDRFRTGSFTVSFNNKHFYVANNYILFTGQANLQPTILDTNYSSKYGYVNMREAKFGNISNGLATVNIGISLPYFQNINGTIGIDDERIRHFFQNKLIHDNALVHALNPKAHNPHIPMIAADGKAFIYKKYQIKKTTRIMLQIGLNDLEQY